MPEWKRLSAPEVLAPTLHDWFETPLGAAVLTAEQRLIDRALTDCFGYHLLQLGIDNRLTLFGSSRVQRCIKAGTGATEVAVRCKLDALPFETDSIDVAILHHALEFSASPHAVLRELHRVIVPHGRLLMVGFNPWSPLGARLWLAGRLGQRHRWHQHWLSPARMHDWLGLLGFACERTGFAFHGLPTHRTAAWGVPGDASGHWLDYSPLGGAYLITAVKSVASGIQIKPRWTKMRPRLAALPVAKPTTTSAARSVESSPDKNRRRPT